MLKDNGDKVSGSEKSDVEAALSEARTVLQGSSSAADMNAAREKVTKASHKLAEAMYKANAAGATASSDGAAGTPGDAGEKKEEGVIDAEYVDVADKK
jgi:molecular chaperone DnaK